MIRSRRKVWRSIAVSSAFLAVLVFSGTFAEAGSGGLPPGPAKGTTAGNASPLYVAAGLLHTLGRTQFASSYAGILITGADNVTIYMAQPDPSFTSQAATLLAGAQITYVSVAYSYQQLLATEYQMAISDQATLAAQGVAIASVLPDPATNSLDVTLETPATPSATYIDNGRAVLESRYGSALVNVEDATMPAATPALGSRTTDFRPFYGGDSVTDLVTDCTSGFIINDREYGSAILTAGHCFYTDDSVYINGDGNYVGEVLQQYLPDLGVPYDFEVLAGEGGDGYVWGGAPSNSNPPEYPVIGAEDPAPGCCMTMDGAVTGEVRGLEVTGEDVCVTVSGEGKVCDLGSAQGSSAPCHSGDSGGPAMIHPNNELQVYASGTIVAINSQNSHICYFQEITTEESVANFTVTGG